MDTINIILSVSLIIFYAIRWRPSVIKRIIAGKINRYLFVGEILILSLAILQLTGRDPLRFEASLTMRYFWLAVALSGAVISSLARLTLKKNYLPAMAAAPSVTMTTNGLYTIVRHPSYLGSVLALAGFELALSSYFVFIAIILLFIIIRQMKREEAMLQEVHGPAWQEYVQRTKYKLIPFIY